MSTVSIDSKSLRESKRLLTRLRFNRSKLGVITHVLLTSDDQGIRLAVSDLDHWLEIRLCSESSTPINLLIPPDALDAACRADKGTEVTFTLFGSRKSRELGLTRQSGGIEVTSVHPTIDVLEFPVRPGLQGIESQLPPETLQALAMVEDCASTDSTRPVLNGVFFTPENASNLVATDGRLLACCPAAVPPQEFILPNLAVKALGHPAFLSGVTTVTWLDGNDEEIRRVAFRCGNGAPEVHRLGPSPAACPRSSPDGRHWKRPRSCPAFSDPA